MLIYEYKLDGRKSQYAAIDEAIRVVQFIRNKCLRLWMDSRGINRNDLQCYCALLAKEYAFANHLNSQARQASADRAWFAISRFYDNCKTHKPGKKGYPKFQHDNRSIEYKTTGWKLEPDGKHSIPIIAVAPQFTSQACSACGAMVKKSLSVRTHICPNCGVVLDRDYVEYTDPFTYSAVDGVRAQPG